jgi:nitrous oxidase accessory protein NosD
MNGGVMQKHALLLLMALSIAASASAQTKFTGKVHCAKGDPEYAIEVGDQPGHLLTARKAACTWQGGEIAGLKVKSAQDVATGEVTGATARDNGYHTATMDNGDTYTVHFSGAATMAKDKTGSLTGKWTFVSGTGKLKGIKGGGTYKGTLAADGGGDVEVEGDYTLAAKTTAPGSTK